jgi:membrane protease YdiL (CAAX protease family)
MKRCGYCGKQNEGDSLFCFECGTALPSETADSERGAGAVSLPFNTPQLNARRATTILGIFLMAQLVSALLVWITGVVVFQAQGHDVQVPKQLRQFHRIIFEPVVSVGTIGGGVALLLISRSLKPEELYDGGPFGAAWVIGPIKRITQGLGTGALLGLLGVLLIVFGHRGGRGSFGHGTTVTLTANLLRALGIFTAVVLAPPIEELLFRGLLYGGYRRSLGPFWAATLTTGIFCILHPWAGPFRRESWLWLRYGSGCARQRLGLRLPSIAATMQRSRFGPFGIG